MSGTWIEPPARLPDGFVPPSTSIHPPRARRVWHPDTRSVVHAVVTHDYGEIYTVQPNTAERALREAARVLGRCDAHPDPISAGLRVK